MHELVLVEGLISEVRELAHQKKGRVIGFKIAIGELAQFENSLIEELLFQLVKGTELETAKIVIEIEKSEVRCLYCGANSGFRELIAPLSENDKEMVHFFPELINAFSKCPKCENHDLEIKKGRSVRLVEVELDV